MRNLCCETNLQLLKIVALTKRKSRRGTFYPSWHKHDNVELRLKKKRIFTGMLLRETVQSWVRGPVVFTEAKTTKTLENRAEKLSSTSTPQRNISRLFRGSSERRNESYCLFFLNIPQTTLFFTFSHLPDRFNLVKDRLRHPQTDNIWRSSLQMWKKSMVD